MMTSLVFKKSLHNEFLIRTSCGYRVLKEKVTPEDRSAYVQFVAWSPFDTDPKKKGVELSDQRVHGLASRCLGTFSHSDKKGRKAAAQARDACELDARGMAAVG